MSFIKNQNIKKILLILFITICNYSCSQLKYISSYESENKKDNSCDSCLFLKISNDYYKIENYEKIYKNDSIIFESETDYLVYYQIYNDKKMVITYHDLNQAKSSVGFELRPIIKMIIISLNNPKDIKTYNCFESFCPVHIKKIKDNGEVYIQRKIKPTIQ